MKHPHPTQIAALAAPEHLAAQSAPIRPGPEEIDPRRPASLHREKTDNPRSLPRLLQQRQGGPPMDQSDELAEAEERDRSDWRSCHLWPLSPSFLMPRPIE